jgi:O-antigen ligase
MDSNICVFKDMQLQNKNYNYYQIYNSYIIFLIIFGIFLYNIFSFITHSESITNKIIIIFAIISFFVFIYYTRLKHFNFFRIFYDFLFSILLVFTTYINIYFSLNTDRPQLFAVLIILLIIWRFITNKTINKDNVLIIIIFFVFSLLLNIIINGITNESYKINSFLIYTLIPCFYISVIIDKQMIDIMKNLIAYFIVLSILLAFLNLINIRYEVLSIFVGNPISTSFVYGVGFLYVFFNIKCKKILYRIIKLGMLSLFIYLMIITGARGPIIALLFTIFISCLIYYSQNKIRIVDLSIFLLLIIILSFSNINLININNSLITRYAGMNRIKITYDFLKNKNLDDLPTINKRLYLYKKSYKEFLERPLFGKGIGRNEKLGEYPHNSFLEIASEIGIIGLIPFAALIIYWFYLFIKSEMKFLKISEYRFFKYLFIYALIQSFFSGSIFWDIFFWSSLIISGKIFKVENKNYI